MNLFEHDKVYRYMNGGFWGDLFYTPVKAAEQYFNQNPNANKIDIGAGWYNGYVYSTANERCVAYNKELTPIEGD